MIPSSTGYKGVGHELCSGVWGHVSPACLRSSLGPCTFALPQELGFLIGSAVLILTMWNPPPHTHTQCRHDHGSPLHARFHVTPNNEGKESVLSRGTGSSRFSFTFAFSQRFTVAAVSFPWVSRQARWCRGRSWVTARVEKAGSSLLTHTWKQCNPLFWFP